MTSQGWLLGGSSSKARDAKDMVMLTGASVVWASLLDRYSHIIKHVPNPEV